ncbi:MAG: TRAP transporter small permease subunit [Alphaproteobacteria bacterium]|nr:TRAP transporter small permease subunit [Alphaproteobacteria bacterium]
MIRKLRGALDAVGVLCFAAVFVAINIQVFMRYIANRPVSWSEEFPTLAFSIAALWAASFCLKAKDHIYFDLVYEAAPLAVRRLMTLAAGIAVAGATLWSLPPIVDFALYMKVLSTPILRVRLDFVFGFFALFIAALGVRALWDIVRAVGGNPDA